MEVLLKLSPKKFLYILIFLIFFTNISIIYDISYYRPFLGFFICSFLSGFLIIKILKLNNLGIVNQIILSVGSSLSILIFLGLFLNTINYPLNFPLNKLNILFGIDIIFSSLTILFVHKNWKSLNDNILYKVSLSRREFRPFTLFTILLPFLGIIGTYAVNKSNTNIISLFLFLSIILVFSSIIIWDNKDSWLYPVVLWSITLSLFLIKSVRFETLPAGACNIEYFFFQQTLLNLHWDPNFVTPVLTDYNSCLSITILPSIYRLITGVQGESIFKLLFSSIASIIPLTAYTVFKNYIEPKYAFAASIFFLAQYPLISMLGWIGFRQLLALIFFYLLVFIILDKNLDRVSRYFFFIVFSLSMLFSHYSTVYITLLLFLLFYVILYVFNYIQSKGYNHLNINLASVKISIYMIIIIFTFICLWNIFIQSNVATGVFEFLFHNVQNAFQIQLDDIHSNNLLIFGSYFDMGGLITSLIYKLSFLMILVGFVFISAYYRKMKFDFNFFILMLVSIILTIIIAILSKIIVGYGVDRFFIQILIFIAPCYIMGIIVISKIIKKVIFPKIEERKIINLLLVIFLILQFLSATYLIYQFTGQPYSEFINNDGVRYDLYFVSEGDTIGSSWINNQRNNNDALYADASGVFINYKFNPINVHYLKPNLIKNGGMVFLHRVNNQENKFVDSYSGDYFMNETETHILKSELIIKNNIYNNGDVTILI